MMAFEVVKAFVPFGVFSLYTPEKVHQWFNIMCECVLTRLQKETGCMDQENKEFGRIANQKN